MSSEQQTYTTPLSFCSPGLRKLIVRLQIASEEQIARVEGKVQDLKIIASLAAEEGVDETEALSKISASLGVPAVDLKNPKVAQQLRSSGIIDRLDTRFSLINRCVPLYREADHIVAALADPLDAEVVSELEFVFGRKVSVRLAREKDILYLVNRITGNQVFEEAAAQFEGVEHIEKEAELVVGEDHQTDISMKKGSESAPVVRLVNRVLADALEMNASDVHLEPNAKTLEVRFRVDGIMSSHLSVPGRLQSYVITRLKILAGMDITERRRPQDGRFRISIGKQGKGDARVSSVPTPFGEKMVLRLLRSTVGAWTLDSLGLTPRLEEEIKQVLGLRDRIVAVTGPTGSGKTTSLYAGIHHLREGTTNIITVEDPIEYRIDGITQIQVDEKIGMTFASGLRSILRQDPDIIMVGEIRDLETAEVAFQAAQTGHLVLSTLHTNSAASAVVRLMDLGLEPFVIASSLGAILAQRLVRKLCDACARPLNEEERNALFSTYGIVSDKASAAVGCEKCEQSGYRGRLGLYSLLVVDPKVRELIRNNANEEEIEQFAVSSGMQTLLEAGCEQVADGLTSISEVERVVGRLDGASRCETSENLQVSEKEKALENVDDLRASFVEKSEEALTTLQLESVFGPKDHTTQAPQESYTSNSIANLASEYREQGETDGIKVLLVDDDEGIRAVMSRAFRRADFVVREASDGSRALEELHSFSPDIIVSDLIMPVMDGEELVKNLRKTEATKEVPVLMLTGSDDEANEIKLIQAGANDFVSKVSSPALVVARVKRILSR